MNPSPPGRNRDAPPSDWRSRWRLAHFHDYTPAAFRMWLAIAAAGAAAITWALFALAGSTAEMSVQTLVALLFVAVAAWFPIEIPRSKYSIGAADVFIFSILAVLGAPAAILAAGCEGLIGASRSTRRLTSRISTPAAAMAAMAVCAAAFEGLSRLLTGIGMARGAAVFTALVLASVVPFVMTTLPLTATVTLKRGAWPDLREWFSNLSWMAAVYIAAALAAGVVQLVADRHGGVAFAMIAAAVLAVVMLLRTSIANNEAEHRKQEERISEAEREAHVNEQRFAAAFADAAIGMAIVDADGLVVRANHALCSLLQRQEAELSGEPFVQLLHPADVERFERQTGEAGRHGVAPAIELRCWAGGGGELWVALHCGRFNDPDGALDGLIYQLHDITTRQAAERRLKHVAYHDSLTDLANRACFHENLTRAVDDSRTDATIRFAVLFLDLDRFKIVNDSLGHFAGNELLREVGGRLLDCLRPHDLVARLGGDEFAVLLRDLGDAEQGMKLAQRVLDVLATPLSISGNEIVPSASIGITFSDLGYRTVDELLRDADLAMYEAKAGGRGRIAVFDRTMHERIADKLSLESQLRHAISEGGLSLVYQPLFDLTRHRLVGFEALARWAHPVRGPVSPDVFIRIAEDAGHIEALTAWAIDRAVGQLAAWHREAPAMARLGMNVNISGRDLLQSGFVGRVLDTLARHGVDANLLTLEITESVLMNHLDRVRETLTQLRASGVRLAIDDFGTGYSSLAYLSRLPIDSLKIDRSFVTAMGRGSEDIEIVRAVTMLGRTLSKTVVAEGIETAEQLSRLREIGVHIGQGYLLSRPLTADKVAPLLVSSPAPTVA